MPGGKQLGYCCCLGSGEGTGAALVGSGVQGPAVRHLRQRCWISLGGMRQHRRVKDLGVPVLGQRPQSPLGGPQPHSRGAEAALPLR